jgi:hypothetical protein
VVQTLPGRSCRSFHTRPKLSNRISLLARIAAVLLPLPRRRISTLASAVDEMARV